MIKSDAQRERTVVQIDGFRQAFTKASGDLRLPRLERLDQIAPLITKVRIAKGFSQTELARRLGVSKQVISRYEENDYQTVAIGRLQEILDAIGVKTQITLGAPGGRKQNR